MNTAGTPSSTEDTRAEWGTTGERPDHRTAGRVGGESAGYDPADDYGEHAELLQRLADPSMPPAQRRRVREELVRAFLPVAEHIAQRFARRGQPLEDLRQVAAEALLKAIDRFDPARGRHFLSFAVPTITGEIRRYFRDYSWMVRVPRRAQELRAAINAAVEELSQQLDRAPTAGEIAAHLRVDVEEVRSGYLAMAAYSALSVDDDTGDGEQDTAARGLRAQLGANDPALATVEVHELLQPALARLPERERTLIGLRFFHQLSQSAIARRLGMSQMHVSRLLSRSLAELRHHLDDTASADQDADRPA